MDVRIFLTIILILTVLLPKDVHSKTNEADSLRAELRTDLPDTSRIKTLIRLSHLMGRQNSKESLILADSAFQLSVNLQDERMITLARLRLSVVYHWMGHYKAAVSEAERVIEICKRNNDKNNLSKAFGNLGIFYQAIDEHEKAIKYLLQALVIRDTLFEPKSQANTLNNLGKLFYLLKNHDKAFNYYPRAMKIYGSINNKEGLSTVYNNLGIIHANRKEFDTAFEYYKRSLYQNKEDNDLLGMSYNLNNIGVIWYKLGNYGKALRYFQQTLPLRETIQNPKAIAMAHFNIGDAYYLYGNTEKAIEHLDKSVENSKGLGMITILKLAYEMLSQIHENEGHKIEALNNFKLYKEVEDSIERKNNRAKIVELEAIYEIDKRERTIAIHQSEIVLQKVLVQQKETQRNAVLIGSFLLLCIIILLWIRYKEKTALNKLLTEQQAEIETVNVELSRANLELKDFAQIVSHDLKAPLRGISGLVKTLKTEQADKMGQEGIALMDVMTQRANKMQELIMGVLNYSMHGDQNNTVEEVDLNALNQEIIELIDPPTNMEISISKLPSITGDRSRYRHIFQNLLTNAVKYMDKDKGVITISSQDVGRFYEFTIADNGPGIELQYHDKIFKIFQTLNDNDNDSSTGIGLALVKRIVTAYGGSIWLKSTPGTGTTFHFTLPKN